MDQLDVLDAEPLLETQEPAVDEVVDVRLRHVRPRQRVVEREAAAIPGGGEEALLDERAHAAAEIGDAALIEAGEDLIAGSDEDIERQAG